MPVNKKSRCKARKKSSDGISTNQKTKLFWRNIKEWHQVITQWHHDHKIKDVGKVDGSQQYYYPDLFFLHSRAGR